MQKLKDVEILQPSIQSSDQMLLPHLSKDGDFGDDINRKKPKSSRIIIEDHDCTREELLILQAQRAQEQMRERLEK